jgi:hypothetical protein
MKKTLACVLILSAAILSQSCHKSETHSAAVSKSILDRTTGLSLYTAGEYGTYEFLDSEDGLAAQDSAYSLFDGTTGLVATYTGDESQKWRLTYMGNGYITIMNICSGKFAQANSVNGINTLVQNSADNADDQLWLVKPVSAKGYEVVSKTSGLAITANGANPIQLQPLTGTAAQIWGYDALPPTAYRDDQVVQYLRRYTGSISFDQVNSIPLTYGANNGKSLWIGEDTFTDNNGGWNPVTRTFPCYGGDRIQFFDVRNSALLQPASHSWDPIQTSNVITHNSTYKYEILASPDPTNHGGTYTWPGVGVEIGSHVYMYAHEGGTTFNQTVMYDFTENPGGLDWGTAVRHVVPGLSTQNTIGYAIGWVKANDSYVYVYGGLTDAFGGSYLQVARFASATPFTWQFWNGTAWGDTVVTAPSSQIRTNASNSSALKSNSSMCYINGKFVLVEMDFGYGCPSPNSLQNIYIFQPQPALPAHSAHGRLFIPYRTGLTAY